MKRKKHGPEEIIRKVREAEALEAAGQTVGQVCQKLEVSEGTLHRWRKQYRGMGDDAVAQRGPRVAVIAGDVVSGDAAES